MLFGVGAPVMKFISKMLIKIIGEFMGEKLCQVLTSGNLQAFL